jgi:ferric-dicitrate binding protein FerR (iron transport regulator)
VALLHQHPHNLPKQQQPQTGDAAYEAALELSRAQQYAAARAAFEALVRAHPNMCKAWVSYAQMEKRIGRLGDPQRLDIARFILQRGASRRAVGGGCVGEKGGAGCVF